MDEYLDVPPRDTREGNKTISTQFEGLMTCSDGDDRNKLIDMITQTVTSVCDVAAISVGGRPHTARGPHTRTHAPCSRTETTEWRKKTQNK